MWRSQRRLLLVLLLWCYHTGRCSELSHSGQRQRSLLCRSQLSKGKGTLPRHCCFQGGLKRQHRLVY